MRRACLLVLLLAVPVRAAEPAGFFPFFEPVTPPRPVQVMVHRGLAAAAPENSKRALQMCIEDFYEWVEVDVRLSRDGEHFLLHDERLDGKTNGTGLVRDRTAAELLALDAGSWFAPRFAGPPLTLSQALRLARGRINLYLDCKQIDPERLVKDVTEAGMERQVIVYTDRKMAGRLRELSNGKVPVMVKWRPGVQLDEWLTELKPNAVEIDAGDVTAAFCRDFHRHGIKVQAKVLGQRWDNPEVWQRVATAGVDWVQTDRPLEFLFHDVRRRHPKWPVQIAFHRGANRYAPENTLPALEGAARIGADYIEFDIRTTKDGQHVLMHDTTVDRTTNGSGRVRDLNAADIGKLDAGARFGKHFAGTRVPALADALTALGPKAHGYLDSKDIAVEDLAGLLEKRNLFDRSVVYQSADYLRKLKKLQPKARALPPVRTAKALDALGDLQPYGVDVSWFILTKELFEHCHGKGIRVFADALGLFETVEQYRKGIDWGIDVIQTDHPARVLRAIELTVERK
jgi:glycerophosphoryl diester phosphodiesterase